MWSEFALRGVTGVWCQNVERVLITWGDGGVRMLSEFSLSGVTGVSEC